ncbi:hypothetical protein [Kitasatospora sp. NPDC088134]|uniref:hypothetical protein n=1 Tax=Kitasatospora sp. NPDC088134 TaxID=3364071 RepID=UPI0038254943
MEIFECAHCATALTRPVARARFPAHAHHQVRVNGRLPALMAAGSYAVDPEPSGPPWRPWSRVAPEEAERRGYWAPVRALSEGLPGRVVCAPGDVLGTEVVPERAAGGCCGIGGPNLACRGCRRIVGSLEDLCDVWHAVWLEPDEVRARPVGPSPPPAGWAELVHDRSAPPPLGPDGRWSPRAEQDATVALVQLLAAADGALVRFEHRSAAALFGTMPEQLRPGGTGPARRCALHGPGLPLSDPRPELAIVPLHPQTGESWPVPPGVTAVPLDLDLWRHLAHGRHRPAVRVGGALRAALDRDEPAPAPHPPPAWFDAGLLADLLARRPAVRGPALGFAHCAARTRTWW